MLVWAEGELKRRRKLETFAVITSPWLTDWDAIGAYLLSILGLRNLFVINKCLLLWFSNFSRQQQEQPSPPRVSDSAGVSWDLRICISNKFSGDYGCWSGTTGEASAASVLETWIIDLLCHNKNLHLTGSSNGRHRCGSLRSRALGVGSQIRVR